MTKPKRKLVPIIDKKFQVKTTFSIIGIVSIISVIVVASISFRLLSNDKKLSHINEIEDNIFQVLTQEQLGGKESSLKNMMKDIVAEHIKNQDTIRGIKNENSILRILLIIYVLVQGILLFWILIRKTHKISGPIYVMSNYMRQIINGMIPKTRPLRVNDELKEFYLLFEEMVSTISGKGSAKVKTKTKPAVKAKTTKKTAAKKTKAKTKKKK